MDVATPSAVVVIGHTDCCGNLADTVCRSITFHTDPQHALSHLDSHPELQGIIIRQTDAIALAEAAFGSLLADQPTQPRKLMTSETDEKNSTEFIHRPARSSGGNKELPSG